MTRILLCGCRGRMGKSVAAAVAEHPDCTVVAGIDRAEDETLPFPVFSTPAACSVSADVIVDFSHPSCLLPLLDYAKSHRIPAVICTTGLSEADIAALHEVSRTVPILFSGNMSLGINLLMELAKMAARVLGDSFDIEILEKHHNQKLDAPSGTALMLADAVKEGLSFEPTPVFERHSVRKKRDHREIGIASLRGGTIVGEHEIMFAGRDEIITLSHSARSREIFATGALNAAVFLVRQAPGLYSMADVVKA